MEERCDEVRRVASPWRTQAGKPRPQWDAFQFMYFTPTICKNASPHRVWAWTTSEYWAEPTTTQIYGYIECRGGTLPKGSTSCTPKQATVANETQLTIRKRQIKWKRTVNCKRNGRERAIRPVFLPFDANLLVLPLQRMPHEHRTIETTWAQTQSTYSQCLVCQSLLHGCVMRLDCVNYHHLECCQWRKLVRMNWFRELQTKLHFRPETKWEHYTLRTSLTLCRIWHQRKSFEPGRSGEQHFGEWFSSFLNNNCWSRNFLLREHRSSILHRVLPSTDYLELPEAWHSGLSVSRYLTSTQYRPDINKYKVKAGQTLSEWEDSGWIREQDPRGWFQWYCRFYLGRRSPDDGRQIRRCKLALFLLLSGAVSYLRHLQGSASAVLQGVSRKLWWRKLQRRVLDGTTRVFPPACAKHVRNFALEY